MPDPAVHRRCEAFGRIASLDPRADEIKWAWAVLEQEKMWLADDAYWVQQAAAGWPGCSIYEMLAAYGLLRGKHGSRLAKVVEPARKRDTAESKEQRRQENARREAHRRRFADLARQWAAELRPGDAAANTSTWRAFGQEFAEHCEESADGGWFMPSATLKALWFHSPETIPMYDQFAARGLDQRSGPGDPKDPRGDFLRRAYDLMDCSRDTIREVQDLLGTSYPYEVRISSASGSPASAAR